MLQHNLTFYFIIFLIEGGDIEGKEKKRGVFEFHNIFLFKRLL